VSASLAARLTPDHPLLSPRARAYIRPPYLLSVLSLPLFFTGALLSLTTTTVDNALITSFSSVCSPVGPPRCGVAHGPTGAASPSPERRRTKAAPLPRPNRGEPHHRLTFCCNLVLQCLPHMPLIVQDQLEPRFTLTSSHSHCAMPSMPMSRTSLPRHLMGHFDNSKHCLAHLVSRSPVLPHRPCHTACPHASRRQRASDALFMHRSCAPWAGQWPGGPA
jgi:hypothetical protein